MDLDLMIFSSALGIFMFFFLNFIYFFDWTNLIGKMVKIISPQKKIKEIENNNKLRKNKNFRNHIKKWKKRFLLHPLIFVVSLLIIELIIRNLIISYFLGFIVTIVEYNIMSKKEQEERRKMIKLLDNDIKN